MSPTHESALFSGRKGWSSLRVRTPLAILSVLAILISGSAIPNVRAEEFDVRSLGLAWERSDGHNATLWSVRWSPDGSMLSTTYFDNTTVIWNASSRTRIVKLGAHPNYTSEPEGTKCWGSKECEIDHEDHYPARVSAWSPDGALLAVGGDNRLVIVYETQTWNVVKVLAGHMGSVLSLAWSPDGSMLASGSGPDKVDAHNTPENLIKVWNVTDGMAVANLTAHVDGVMDLKWSADASRLVSASDDKTIRMWDPGTWTNVLNLTGHTLGVLSVDWSPNGTMLVSGSRDFKVMLWNATTGQSLAKWSAPNCQRSVDWHPSADLIAASGPAESLLRIRNSTSGVLLQTYEEAAASGSDVMSARWSPDGRMLAAASGKEHVLRVYSFDAGGSGESVSVPPWLPGTVFFFTLLTVGTVLLIIPLGSMLRRRRGKED